MNYSVNVGQTASYSVQVRAANGTNRAGTLTLKVDGTTVGTIGIPATGGFQNWTTITMPTPINLTSGNHVIQLYVSSRNGAGNLSWINLTTVGGRADASSRTEDVTSERLQVYPNPFAERIRIFGVREPAKVRIYDSTGKLVKTVDHVVAGDELNLVSFSSGVYVLRVHDGDGLTSLRIVKK
jgi:hypothetical protein